MEMASPSEILNAAPVDLASYEDLYKYFHQHPELSKQEKNTAKIAAEHIAKLRHFKLHTNIGGHGFAGVFRNGPGKTILLRADMDALPVKELTGLPYASAVNMADSDGVQKPVMHACGHDMHITCLLAAAETMVTIKDAWSGTLIVLFQPDEERGEGAQAMVDDNLYEKIPVPDHVLGQHLMPLRAGSVGFRAGAIMAAADSLKITVYGRGGHGSMPHKTVDPVVLAANIVVRLQGIVSREIDPNDLGVLTVGSLQAGQTENVISDKAEIGVDFRSIKTQTRDQIFSAIKRIVQAECLASGAVKPPLIVPTRRFPPTINDDSMVADLTAAFNAHFSNFDGNIPRTNVSEDFSTLATSQGKPSTFWFFGGVDPELWDEAEKRGSLSEDIPGNHSAYFAPVIRPTMRTGTDALCIAALTFLRK